MVQLGPDLTMPKRCTVTTADCNGYDVQALLVLDEGWRYRCTELRVTRRDGGPEVSGEGIRAIPLAGIIRDGVLSAAAVSARLQGWGTPPEGIAEHGPTPDALRWVARIYRLAHAAGDTPRKRVEETFGVSPATAGRWVAAAREAGHLGAAPAPGKAGV